MVTNDERNAINLATEGDVEVLPADIELVQGTSAGNYVKRLESLLLAEQIAAEEQQCFDVEVTEAIHRLRERILDLEQVPKEGRSNWVSSSSCELNQINQLSSLPIAEKLAVFHDDTVLQTNLADAVVAVKNETIASPSVSQADLLSKKLQIKQSTSRTDERIESVIERDSGVRLPVDVDRVLSADDYVKILEAKLLSSLTRESCDPEVAEVLHRLTERIKGYRQTSEEDSVENTQFTSSCASESWKQDKIQPGPDNTNPKEIVVHEDSLVNQLHDVQVHEDDDIIEMSVAASTKYSGFLSQGFCFVIDSVDTFDPIESSKSAPDCDSRSSRTLGGVDLVKKWEAELLASRENEGRQGSPPTSDESAPDGGRRLSAQPLSGIDLVKKWEAELLESQDNQGRKIWSPVIDSIDAHTIDSDTNSAAE